MERTTMKIISKETLHVRSDESAELSLCEHLVVGVTKQDIAESCEYWDTMEIRCIPCKKQFSLIVHIN